MDWRKQKYEWLFTNSVTLRDIFGGSSEMTLHDIASQFAHKLTLLYVALATLGFFAADPPGLRSYMPLHWATVVWCVAGCSFVLFFLFLIVLAVIALPDRARRHVYTPVLCALALVPTMVLGEFLAHEFSGGTYPLNGIQRFPFFFLTTLVFEEVFFQFVAPLVRLQEAARSRAAARAKADETKADERAIHIGTERLPISEVTAIESREHFVDVRLRGRVLTIRARLCDIVAQTVEDDGIQPHRSWWVSRSGAPRLCTDDGKPVLRLSDDTVVPVAKARLDAVRDWLSANEAA